MPAQVTSPPRAGQWGNANLPFGDYDPSFSPDGSRIAFERLEDDTSTHGNYNLFVIDATGDGRDEADGHRLLAGPAGLVPLRRQAGLRGGRRGLEEGEYDIHMIDADGSDDRNITPEYFPASFLCHSALFSKDDSQIYFTGQWYS